MSAAKPVIVLVRPQLGQNIGKAARAMLNFGLTEMRLVAPRDGWPNPDAGPSASGADVVLEQAQVFDTVQEAIADCSTVYASTVRRRDLVMPVVTPEQMADEIAGSPGPDRDPVRARTLRPRNRGRRACATRSSRSRSTPNSARSTWRRRSSCSPTNGRSGPSSRLRHRRNWRSPHRTAKLEGLIGQLEEELGAKGYFHPPSRTQATKNTIRTIFTKTGWSSREVKAIRGIVRALVNPARNRPKT